MSFATNPIGFAAPPCGFRSFPCRFVPDRISFQTSTDILAVFLCGIEPFPCGMKSFRCGNESFQHGNGLQQLHEESIECGDARFFHVELTRYHMEETHSYMEMSLSHVASSRPRFASTFQRLTSGLRGLAWSWNDINSRDSNIAPCLTHLSWRRTQVSLCRLHVVPAARKPVQENACLITSGTLCVEAEPAERFCFPVLSRAPVILDP